MNDDVIRRLAAANPVPTGAPVLLPEPAVNRRTALAVALAAAAIAVPAVAFAGALGSLLGISNEGTAVPTSSVLPGESRLDEALESMGVGSSMQSLGTLNGVAFYASRNADGDFCLALEHVDGSFGKGVLCDLNADNFPSADVKAITFPQTLQGVAADGVATVAFADADGNVLQSTPVVDNLFASEPVGAPLPQGAAAYLETFDASGDVLSKQPLPH
jgi:hypothetical protein